MSTNPALNTIVSTINTLTRTTYEQWCFKCKIELGKHLYDIVTGVIDPPDDNDSPETIAAWEVANRNAMRILIPSIIEPEFQLIRNCETARDIWTTLESNFRDISMLRQCNTFEQLISLKYLPEKSIHDHITAFNKLYQEVKTFDHFKDLPDAIWVTRFLRSLPLEYTAFARSYDKELETTKLNDVYGHLRSEFNNRPLPSIKESTPPAASANYASSNSSAKKSKKQNNKGKGSTPAPPIPSSSQTDECGYCHKTNHTRDDCHALKMKLFYELHNPPLTSKKPKPSKSSHSSGNVACYESGYSTAVLDMESSKMLSDSSSNIWIIDSGASNYMVPLDRSCFKDYSTDLPGPNIIKGINGNTKVLGIGTLILHSANGGELVLHDVLHAPGLPYSLLSLGRLMRAGNKIIFNDPYCIIENNTGFYIKSKFAPSFGAVSSLFRFRVDFPVAESNLATSEDQIALWHARVGHVATSGLPHIAKVTIVPESFQTAISGAFPNPGICEPCLEGKQTRLPYPPSENSAIFPLDVIHTDSCHVPVPSIKGYKDFVTFTDQITRMSFVFYLRDKKPSTVLEVFEKFKERVELHFYSKGYKIKAVRMDGGSEYQATLKSFLIEKGISSDRTTHYSPESNGISERLNRTLLDMARTMLFGANLPSKLWTEAVSAAVYLKNRLPHSSLRGDITPHEMWFGTKPSLSHLRVFGCAAHTHIPEERRKKYGDGKINHRSIHTYFVGYDKSDIIYQIWHPSNDSIVRARNVIFDETLYYQDEGDFNQSPPIELPESQDSMISGIPAALPAPPISIERPQYLPEPPPPETPPTIATGPTHWPIPPPPVVESRHSSPSPTRGPVRQQVVSSYSLRSRGFPQNAEALLSYVGEHAIPDNYHDVMRSPDRDLWLKARGEEYTSLIDNQTWTLVPLPADTPVVDSRWTYAIKDDDPPRHKARFCAKGFSQRYGINYEETYAPVVKPETLRVLFAVAAHRKYQIHGMDAVTAFLNSILKETIYVKQAEGFVDAEHPDWVYLLNKALYGLKQSAFEWYNTLKAVLESAELQFKRIESDHAVFMIRTELSTVYLALFVDDMAIFGDDEILIEEIKAKLSSHFKMKDLGIMKRFLGLEIERNSFGDVIISQRRYIERVLERFGMQDCKPAYTPLPANIRLRKRDYDPDNPDPSADQTLYREIIGSLNHPAQWTRPDVVNAISKLSQYLHDPSIHHLTAAKHLLRYFKATIHFCQIYSANQSPKLIGYADADHANDEDDRKSFSGYCFFLDDKSATISHSSKKQSLVAQSTMEAETIALSHAAKEALWLRQLCYDLHVFGDQESPTTPSILMINSDSESALKAIKNPVFHARTKHFDMRHHFIRDVVAKGELSVGYIPGDENPADIFTKSLDRSKHATALGLLRMA
jgi:Reverse transcriptase (RNA-dependent DNA polymerase)/gag-polypeptide of LTR copia-type/Integrase core domain/GAG-pre-integrase domain